MEKMPEIARNGAGSCFFLLIQTLPTFWTTRILILRIFIFWFFWVPNFWLGPSLGPPTWAHPLGPGWGPPTWARHLGPALAHPLGPPRWAGGPLGWAPGVGPRVGPWAQTARGQVAIQELALAGIFGKVI